MAMVWSHFKRISSAIDNLPPEQDFELSHGLEPQISETSGSPRKNITKPFRALSRQAWLNLMLLTQVSCSLQTVWRYPVRWSFFRNWKLRGSVPKFLGALRPRNSPI